MRTTFGFIGFVPGVHSITVRTTGADPLHPRRYGGAARYALALRMDDVLVLGGAEPSVGPVAKSRSWPHFLHRHLGVFVFLLYPLTPHSGQRIGFALGKC